MKENIPGYPGYHVTRDGKVYSCLIQGGSSKILKGDLGS
nr:MAG: NUMOD4 motif protein [Bacteriophage sp.]